MRHLGSSLFLVVALSLAACGENQAERGLAPPDEVSTPESPAEMGKTSEQRQQEIEQQMQEKQIEEFDAEQGAKP